MTHRRRFATPVLIIVLLLGGTSHAQRRDRTEGLKTGWTKQLLDAMVHGCTISVLMPARRDFQEAALKAGNPSAVFPASAEQDIRTMCDCIVLRAARTVSHDQVMQDPTAAFHPLIEAALAGGECKPGGLLGQAISEKASRWTPEHRANVQALCSRSFKEPDTCGCALQELEKLAADRPEAILGSPSTFEELIRRGFPDCIQGKDMLSKEQRAARAEGQKKREQAKQAIKARLDRECAGNNLQSCTKLAGIVVMDDKDHRKAFQLYAKACNGGEVIACANLAEAYEKGVGIERDPGKARQYFQKSCKLGGPKSHCDRATKKD